MEEISVNGENYIKASVLAKKFGYTADYLGQLCRTEQVKATLVGRSWYVNEDSLRQHRQQRYRSSAAKSKESLKEAAESRKERQQQALSDHKLGRTHYEADEAALIPLVPAKETVDSRAENTTQVEFSEISERVEKPSKNDHFVTISRQNIVSVKGVPRPALRTLPAFTPSLAERSPRRPKAINVTPSAIPSPWYTKMAFLTITVLSIEALLFFGSLGLEKRLIVSSENTAMVLYGFDPSEASRLLADTFLTQFHRFW